MQENSHCTHLALETLVEQAKEGNRDSLEEIVRRIQDRMVTRCSLVFSNNPCSCEGCIDYFIETKRLNCVGYQTHPPRFPGEFHFRYSVDYLMNIGERLSGCEK